MKSAKQNAAPTFTVTPEYVNSINAALGISSHKERFNLSKGVIEFSRQITGATPFKKKNKKASEVISQSDACINQIIRGEVPTLTGATVGSIITEKSNSFGYNMLVAALVYKNQDAAIAIIDSINSTTWLEPKEYNKSMCLAIFAFDDTAVLAKLIEKGFRIITNGDSHPLQTAAKLGRVNALALLKENFPNDIKISESKNPDVLSLAISNNQKEFLQRAIELQLIEGYIKSPSPFNKMADKGWYDLIALALEKLPEGINTLDAMLSSDNMAKYLEYTTPTQAASETTNTVQTSTVSSTSNTPKKKRIATTPPAQSTPKKHSKEESVCKAASQLIALITQWSVKKEVTEAALLGANPKHRKDIIAWEDVICQEVGVKNFGQQNCILAALCRIQDIYSNESIKEQSKTSHLKAAREILNLLLSKITNISKLKNQEALFAKALELLELDGGECYTTLSSKGLKATEEQQYKYTPSRSSGSDGSETGGGDDDYKVEPRNLSPVFDAATSEEAERAEAERQRLLAEEAAKQKLADEKAAAEAETEKQRLAAEEAQRVEAERQRLATEEAAAQKAAAEAEAEKQRLAAEEAQRAEAAKQARASKCNGIGAAFSTTLTGALCYATYANQELALSVATSVLEHTYFTAAHTALANTEYGSMIVSFVMENSQECMIAAASLAIVASLITSYCFAYKIADMTIAKAPEAQTVA